MDLCAALRNEEFWHGTGLEHPFEVPSRHLQVYGPAQLPLAAPVEGRVGMRDEGQATSQPRAAHPVRQCRPCATLRHLTLPDLTLPYLALPYLALPYLTVPYLTLPYLTSPHLTSLTLPYLAVPHLLI